VTDELERLAAAKVARISEFWDGSYIVWHTADLRLHALPKKGGDEMVAETEDGLVQLIKDHYFGRTGPKPTDQGSL
jgi:hypothetical protein